MIVLYLRGLNTFGDEQVHLGPLKLGSMTRPTEREFLMELRRRGLTADSENGATGSVRLAIAKGQGTGGPESQARGVLQAMPELSQGREPLVLIGHSAGGLAARVLSYHENLKSRVRKVVAYGSPHRGAYPAESALASFQRRALSTRIATWVGYDFASRVATFSSLTFDAMMDFNKRYPADERLVSLICEVGPDRVGLPLKLIGAAHPTRPGDGFIDSESQSYGEVRGRFEVDHLDAIGHHFHLRSQSRQRARIQFQRLVSTLADEVESSARETGGQAFQD